LKGLLFATDKHTAHETAIRHNPHNFSNWDSTLLDSWVTNTTSVKMLCPQHNCFFLYFRKNIACLTVGLLRKAKSFLFPVQLCICGLRQIAVSWTISCHVTCQV
jgi:hypothetical protein